MSAATMLSFGFEEQTVRVIDRGGAPWFVAQDVCSCLEIGNHRDAVARLDDDEKGVGNADTLGGDQVQLIVSESGVYALIFRSRKPAAVRFRKWVTSEVLPTLRRTGRYIMAANDEAENDILAMETPDDIERMKIKLCVVREARHLHGRRIGRLVWKQLGLPDGQPRPQHPDPLLIGATDPLIREWLDQRCEINGEFREEASALFDDFAEWCNENSEDHEYSRITFGRQLESIGFCAFRSNRTHRRGIRLKN